MTESVDRGAARTKRRRAWTSLVVSLFGGAALLWLASRWLELWPERLELPRPDLLAVGAALYLPYAYARAVRLRFVLDPLVREASDGARQRLDWRLLQGSGLFSFFVVLMLPLRLGELSRPLLLARGDAPGIALPESLGAVAVERVLDGVFAVGMLFVGLAFATALGDDPQVAARLGYVSGFGRLFGAIFAAALLVLGLLSRWPGAPGRAVGALLGRGPLALRLADFADRLAASVAPLWRWRQGLPFVAWTAIYWGLTVTQVWFVLRATGLEVGPAEAMATVAIVGLSIQLPGGPAQAGSFQVGVALALSLFLPAEALALAGSSFAAVMYLLTVFGALAVFPVGAALLWLVRRGGPAAPTGDDRVEPAPVEPTPVEPA